MEKSDSARLSSIETTVDEIHHRLFGNGQPGDIDKLHGRINDNANRIGKLEAWRGWLIGVGIGIGVASGAAGMKFIEALIR